MKLKIIWISIFSLITVNAYTQPVTIGGNDANVIIDKVIAQIGDNIILFSEIETQKVQARSQAIEVDEQTQCYMLEEMLFQNLLLNQAKLDSIEIGDPQVNAEMENRLRTIEAQIGSKEALEQFYGKSYLQIKNEFREVIRDRMMSQEMERTITSGVQVSPRDVKKFFNSIPQDSLPYVNAKIGIQQIVVFPEVTQEDKNKTINEMNEWRTSILKGDRSFESLAKIYSEDPGSAQQGGEISGTKGMMVKPFESALFSLKEGEISDVFETEYGFHFLQLLERKGDDYKVRHILRIPEVNRASIIKASNIIEECYDKLQTNEITWAQAVTLYSEDEDTKQNRGNLSNPYTGEQLWDMENLNQIDPQIFIITDNLKVGEFSEPSLFADPRQRKQGVRIIKLSERTKPHVANLKDDYNFIKQAAENDKKTEIITNWVNNKIPNVFIKIDKDYTGCSYRYNW